ncbi:MAG: PASTA domain-containing protein, partial [Planctomycetota bacterium]
MPIATPDVVGLSEANATSAIEAAGLRVGTVTYEYSYTVPAGEVMSQNPAAGVEVPIGSPVDLVVSSGPPVTVPDVGGRNEADASSDITAAGLIVGTVTYAYSDTVAAGDVISQSPIGGAVVSVGSPVDLVVSSGLPPVPYVVGKSESEAYSAISAVDNLQVGTVSYEHSDIVGAGIVIIQNPAPYTPVPTGSSVDLVISLGRPEVPPVVGKTLAEATIAIEAVDNLQVGTVTLQYSDTVAVGLAISQNPASGQIVPIGSPIDLIISLGPAALVPNVVDMTEAGATAAIAGANLVVGAITYEYSETVTAGLVISQNPAAGITVPAGSYVDIVVSRGRPVVVPPVVGMSEDLAGLAISSSGLVVGPVTYECSDTIEEGVVISQSPMGGTTVPEGSSVELTVSLGPAVVPDLVGKTESEATSALAAFSLTVGAISFEYSDTIAIGRVVIHNPGAGTIVPVGSSVDLVLSLGQPVGVPNVVGISKVDANSAIAGAGLTIGNVTYEYSDTAAPGTVISQNPVYGTGVPLGSGVDLVVSLGRPVVAVALGGSRLVELQNNDGGWDWPSDDGDPCSQSDPNSFASAAMGLAQAYRQTSDANMLAGLQKAKAFLLSKTDNFGVNDGAAAIELDGILGGTACTDHVLTNFYDKLAAGTYYDWQSKQTHDTSGYVGWLQDRRSQKGIGNLAAWDLGLGVYSAHVIGANTTQWIEGLKAEIDELDKYGAFDVLGLAGAVFGLAAAGEDYDPQAGEHEYASNLGDLAEILASYQIETGGFSWWGAFIEQGNETQQETVYALMALNEFERAGYLTEICDAGIYLQNVQLPGGGWENYVGAPEGESPEITGEALRGITAAAGQSAVVPYAVGMSETAVYSMLAAAGLLPDTVYEYSETIPAGEVMSQSPAAGTEVPVSSFVDLIVSVGPPVTVPDVTRMPHTDANSAITTAKLTVGTITYDYSDTVAVGHVIAQNPAGYTTAPEGSNVDLVISLGQPAVPGVVGLPQAEAISRIEAVDNLRVVDVNFEYSDTAAVGLVVSQNPDANTIVPVGSFVRLVVSLGQGAVVPPVTGIRQADANSAVLAAGLVVGAVAHEYNDVIIKDYVISQNPVSG